MGCEELDLLIVFFSKCFLRSWNSMILWLTDLDLGDSCSSWMFGDFGDCFVFFPVWSKSHMFSLR